MAEAWSHNPFFCFLIGICEKFAFWPCMKLFSSSMVSHWSMGSREATKSKGWPTLLTFWAWVWNQNLAYILARQAVLELIKSFRVRLTQIKFSIGRSGWADELTSFFPVLRQAYVLGVSILECRRTLFMICLSIKTCSKDLKNFYRIYHSWIPWDHKSTQSYKLYYPQPRWSTWKVLKTFFGLQSQANCDLSQCFTTRNRSITLDLNPSLSLSLLLGEEPSCHPPSLFSFLSHSTTLLVAPIVENKWWRARVSWLAPTPPSHCPGPNSTLEGGSVP